MCRPYGLQCSGLAISILGWAGELDNISQEEKRQVVDFFLSCQDPNDGYFKDPLVDDTQWAEHRISWQEVWHQMSGVIVAVTTLSAKPRFPLPRERFADLESVDIRKWIHSLDWTNSWRVGTLWAWAIISLIWDWARPATPLPWALLALVSSYSGSSSFFRAARRNCWVKFCCRGLVSSAF